MSKEGREKLELDDMEEFKRKVELRLDLLEGRIEELEKLILTAVGKGGDAGHGEGDGDKSGQP